MNLELEGKGAIVTGGSLGIGRAIALELAREGANVAVNYRRHDAEAKEVVAEIESMGRRGLAVKADVSSYADAEAMVRRVQDDLGRFDILVCNAGITWDGVIWKMTEEQWDAVISVNLKGYFNYNKAAAMRLQGPEVRQDRQHLVDQRDARQVRAVELRGVQGRRDRHVQVAGQGAGQVQRQRQRGRARAWC